VVWSFATFAKLLANQSPYNSLNGEFVPYISLTSISTPELSPF